jgi:hypothetical protein
MAGDWIKMRTNLAQDPAVFRIMRASKLDRFAVIGRLHAFWSWADEHTVDGEIHGVDLEDIDVVCQTKGFSAHLVLVGWLEVLDGCIRVPNFSRHNGDSAKRRMNDTEKKRTQRSGQNRETCPQVVPSKTGQNRDTCPESVPETTGQAGDKTGTREEKRREEKTIPPLTPLPGGNAAGQSSDEPSPETRQRERTLPAVLDTPKFRQHWGDWLQYTTEINKGRPLPCQTIDRHMTKLATMGEAQAIKAIENAISRGFREPELPMNGSAKKAITEEAQVG